MSAYITIGTAIVASTNVRSSGDIVLNHLSIATFMTASVGKTQSQIMKASWCLLGG